ncbi:tetratricopeptide repeat protein [Hydrogenobacter sp. T-2]|uniref:tetratricopeptide repeat protein n=1 Tax=Pampinifervens diazotrophicum TaxID=1632018 RepID=UPI002B25BD21|nr:tetratricopeptide repeat protein [Hydrogenobacter sp. T-2]WPM32921.1 tetratricopeptide repeat protein [Hydrogenobacter sp. T-2]
MRGIFTALSLFSLIWLASCGGITKEEFDKRIASLEGRISQLEERQRSLEERNLRTEARVDTLSENLARTRLELERLRVERQSTAQATRLPEPIREVPQPSPSIPERVQETPLAQRDNPQQATEEYQREYDEALRLYNLRQLNQARDKFIDFIRRYPRTPLTDNAYLWLGVVYRDLGETNKAEAVWLTLVERCQRKEMVDCNKAPSALLQLARLYEQRGDNQKAREYYEAILRDYPLSEEAGTARTRLGR